MKLNMVSILKALATSNLTSPKFRRFKSSYAESRTNCVACKAEIPPGKPGRRCAKCRSGSTIEGEIVKDLTKDLLS